MKWLVVLLMVVVMSGCVTAKQVGMFCLGALSAGVVHEGSHWVVAKMSDRDIEFHGLAWKMKAGESDETLQLAGLVGNALASEVALLAYDGETGFAEGLIAANTYEEITYPIFRGMTDDFHGHIDHPDSWRVGFVAHGLSVAARAGAKKVSKKGWGLGLLPSKEGGTASLGYRW